MAIPVHILSGFLGAGKTSAIRHQLASRPGEKIAVIVNDFGEAGFDEAVIAGDAPFQITNIPGACVCCTAPEGFVSALGAILEGKPDRLLIEPTGLARPQDLVDTIRRGPHRADLELEPVAVLVDPRKLTSPSPAEKSLIEEQAEVADVLVANQVDLCTEADLLAFDAWAEALWPSPLAIVKTSHGELTPEQLAWPEGEGARLSTDAAPSHRDAESSGHEHHDHPETHASTEGFSVRSLVWSAAIVFERDRIEAVFANAASAGGTLARAKGLFRTREGTMRIEWAGGALTVAASAHRRDSRADIIAQGKTEELLDAIEAGLEAAVLSEAELRAQANQIEFVLPEDRTEVLERPDISSLDGRVDDVSTLFPKREGAAASMQSVLARVGAPETGHAVICAADGFASEPVPLHALRAGLLLHSVGGDALPNEKGGPFRLLIPEGVPDAPSACANVKSVTRIVVRS